MNDINYIEMFKEQTWSDKTYNQLKGWVAHHEYHVDVYLSLLDTEQTIIYNNSEKLFLKKDEEIGLIFSTFFLFLYQNNIQLSMDFIRSFFPDHENWMEEIVDEKEPRVAILSSWYQIQNHSYIVIIVNEYKDKRDCKIFNTSEEADSFIKQFNSEKEELLKKIKNSRGYV